MLFLKRIFNQKKHKVIAETIKKDIEYTLNKKGIGISYINISINMDNLDLHVCLKTLK